MLLAIVVCSAGIAMGQTEWVEYPDNPVIEPGESGSWNAGGNWGTAAIFDGSMYHLWFTGHEQNGYWSGVGHATSTDGVEWTMDPGNPVIAAGESGEWDDSYVLSGAVIHDGTQFHMWYSGSGGAEESLGYATSPDGSMWTKHDGNPVMDAGASGTWDDTWLGPSSVIADGENLRMWYWGSNGSGGSIGYAESPDGIHWTKLPEPVLEPQTIPGGAWDAEIVYTPLVIFNPNPPMYQMWYGGNDTDTPFVGYAFSSDGIEWTRHRDNPVIEAGHPVVLFDGSNYHMWYAYYDGVWRISYATSDCCAGVAGLNHLLTFPAAAVASGAEGAFYQTDVDLNNASDQAVEYEFMWLPRGETNSAPSTSEPFGLGAGMSVRYANVLSEVFGLEPNSLGALSILSSSPDLLAMSRTYNSPEGEEAGTFGQAISAVAPGDFIQTGERRRILFASEHDDLRFNVGCQNGGDGSMVVNLELFDAEGTSLEQTMMILRAWGNDQLNRVFQDYQPVNGYVDVWTTQANKSFYCYGSVLDNVTSDPTTVLPQ